MISECSFALPENDIHVWTLGTRVAGIVAADFEPVLTTDERLRAAGFRFDHLRYAFVVARGALRYLLGHYLDVPPASIRFDYGPNGKPALAAAAEVQFNTAHSGDLAVFAFTRRCPIGVDVEQMRPLAEMDDIAKRFFCSDEAVEIGSLSPGDRTQAFFHCWTRKEAYIKAIGGGLSIPLNAFRVTVQPGEAARLLHIAQNTDAASEWTLHDLCLQPGYAAALAYHDLPRPFSIFPIDAPEELINAP